MARHTCSIIGREIVRIVCVKLQLTKKQLAPAKASTHDVFTDFLNGGAWPTDGLSFFVGLVGSVFAMFGKSHL